MIEPDCTNGFRNALVGFLLVNFGAVGRGKAESYSDFINAEVHIGVMLLNEFADVFTDAFYRVMFLISAANVADMPNKIFAEFQDGFIRFNIQIELQPRKQHRVLRIQFVQNLVELCAQVKNKAAGGFGGFGLFTGKTVCINLVKNFSGIAGALLNALNQGDLERSVWDKILRDFCRSKKTAIKKNFACAVNNFVFLRAFCLIEGKTDVFQRTAGVSDADRAENPHFVV